MRIRTTVRLAQYGHILFTRALRRLTPEAHPRVWSNQVIRDIGKTVTGNVIHVSAWRDEDKSGGTYREYFPNAARYEITNFGGIRGEVNHEDMQLDLAAPLSLEQRGAYDFVLNHTTIEHVYPIETAIANLFALSRSEVLIVVPFMQIEHWESPSYGDYWRVGAHALAAAASDSGFEVLALTSNHNAVWPIYYALHARKRSDSDGRQARGLWDVVSTADGFGSRPVSERHPMMS